MKEISIDELLVLPRDSYELIDIRDEELTLYGMIPGAVNINIDEDGTTSSKRLETKKLIAQLKKDNPSVESNIFNSIGNVNLYTVIGYKKNGVRYSFLYDYDVPER